MSTNVILQTKLSIESEFLNKKLNFHIFEKLKIIMDNKCTKENGYFLNIIKIKKILDNYISSNCENIFIIEYEAELLKPEIGKIFEGNVCMIFSGGIFLNINNKLKILIPVSNIDYIFDSKTNSFKKGDKEIKVLDLLKAKITGLKYSKQNFSCFGVLIN